MSVQLLLHFLQIAMALFHHKRQLQIPNDSDVGRPEVCQIELQCPIGQNSPLDPSAGLQTHHEFLSITAQNEEVARACWGTAQPSTIIVNR